MVAAILASFHIVGNRDGLCHAPILPFRQLQYHLVFDTDFMPDAINLFLFNLAAFESIESRPAFLLVAKIIHHPQRALIPRSFD